MLKKLLAATAIGGLMMSAAVAQSTNPSSPSATPNAMPGASSGTMGGGTTGSSSSASSGTGAASSSSTAGASASAGAGSGQFLQSQSANHFLASEFIGTQVVGTNNERIGDVNNLLFDRSGRVEGVVIGVGGFLGIGEKNVAVRMSDVQIVPAEAAGDNTRTSSTGAGNTGANTGSATGGNTGSSSGAASSTTTGGGTASTSASGSMDPTNVRLKISMTKEQLNGAPSFERFRNANRAGTGTSGTGTGGAGTGMTDGGTRGSATTGTTPGGGVTGSPRP